MNNKHQKLPALTALTTIVNNYKPVQKKTKHQATGITCNLSSKTTRVKSWNRRTRRVLLSQCKKTFFCSFAPRNAQHANLWEWMHSRQYCIGMTHKSKSLETHWHDWDRGCCELTQHSNHSFGGKTCLAILCSRLRVCKKIPLKNFFAEWNRTVTIVQIIFSSSYRARREEAQEQTTLWTDNSLWRTQGKLDMSDITIFFVPLSFFFCWSR